MKWRGIVKPAICAAGGGGSGGRRCVSRLSHIGCAILFLKEMRMLLFSIFMQLRGLFLSIIKKKPDTPGHFV